ncbi:hypothetical protein GCM10010987_76140 [Bradyrhizobium guangdongense]|uniref:Uncharacterized protein n=1 Tax=Bradyrhizobium guangdongense TaxID=1325090 RepID=A0AA87WCY4_9BRAD|nr:hypothetical protein GCM10010987_76140 [Bradyrhizobium guangdongense]
MIVHEPSLGFLGTKKHGQQVGPAFIDSLDDLRRTHLLNGSESWIEGPDTLHAAVGCIEYVADFCNEIILASEQENANPGSHVSSCFKPTEQITAGDSLFDRDPQELGDPD